MARTVLGQASEMAEKIKLVIGIGVSFVFGKWGLALHRGVHGIVYFIQRL